MLLSRNCGRLDELDGGPLASMWRLRSHQYPQGMLRPGIFVVLLRFIWTDGNAVGIVDSI